MKKLFYVVFTIMCVIVAGFFIQTILVENGVKLHISANVDYREKVVTVQYIDRSTELCNF